MLKYAVVSISGRQYNIFPGIPLRVDYLGDVKTFECDKVLLMVSDTGILVGKPFLKEKLILDVLDNKLKTKIRVATYKAKANTRKVKGSTSISSFVKLHFETVKNNKEKD